MARYLVVSIISSGFCVLLVWVLAKNSSNQYEFNKDLHTTLYKVEDTILRNQILIIKKDSLWMEKIKKDASIRGLTIPEMLEKDARFYLKNKNK